MPDLLVLQEAVLDLLNHMKVDKSPGPDNFAPRLLKELAGVDYHGWGVISSE